MIEKYKQAEWLRMARLAKSELASEMPKDELIDDFNEIAPDAVSALVLEVERLERELEAAKKENGSLKSAAGNFKLKVRTDLPEDGEFVRAIVLMQYVVADRDWYDRRGIQVDVRGWIDYG